jgi:hypothetical protein
MQYIRFKNWFMKIKIFFVLLLLNLSLESFAQSNFYGEWREIQHEVPGLKAYFQTRPKWPFMEKGEHRIFLLLENTTNLSMPLHVQLQLSSDELVSEHVLYSAPIELKPNQKCIGRRGGILFKPTKFRPFVTKYDLHFEIAASK